MLLALAAGYVAAKTLVSGSVSRATAPFAFWLFTGGAMALAAFGIGWAVVTATRQSSAADIDIYLQSVEADYGLTPRKILEYAGLFCLLAVIYTIYLYGILKGPDELDLARVGRFCVISAVPFGVLAFFDASWRSRDAAPVALGAWVAVFLGFSEKYGGGCPPTAAFLFTPLVFSALVAHVMGAFRRPADLSD